MSSPEYLGPYRIGDSLGKGGMGAVYEGTHAKSGDRVAVKLISPQVADETRFRRRFDAEVESLKLLRHDGIVRLIGYGEEEGQLFYSMELVDGEPLQKHIRREKRLQWPQAIDYAIQICAALKYAHDFGVIHRDLKPANLLITKSNKVKLVDFGISKLFGYGEQTAAGSILGTADYMAPEQATGDATTPRTDLYSLGSVMYAMLAGRPPFKGKKLTQVIEALKRDKPAPLEMVNEDAPDALVEIIHELLEKAPEDRPPTALAVMNRLKAMQAGLLHDQTINKQDDSTAARIKKGSGQTNIDALKNKSANKTMASGDMPTSLHEVDPSAGTVHMAGRKSTDATIQAEKSGTGDSSAHDTGSSSTAERSTHFQTIDEGSTSDSRVFQHLEKETPGKLQNILSIVALVATLVLCVGVIMFGFRKPSAAELHAQIMSDVTDSKNVDARTKIDSFKNRFPEHELLSDIVDIEMRLRTNSIRSRLTRRKNSLDPYEQIYAKALEQMEQDNSKAKSNLQNWLVLYGDAPEFKNGLDEQECELLDEMVSVAEYQVQHLKVKTTAGLSAETRYLRQRIEQANRLDPAEKRRVLNSIIELHEKDEWAKAEVERAKKELDSLP